MARRGASAVWTSITRVPRRAGRLHPHGEQRLLGPTRKSVLAGSRPAGNRAGYFKAEPPPAARFRGDSEAHGESARSQDSTLAAPQQAQRGRSVF